MCGINGFLNKNISKENSLRFINNMNNAIIHRGPDSNGVFYNYNDKTKTTITLGMQRLSIIDIKGGDQPIYSDDKKKIIVFNGEIYNFQILKKNLIQKGINFKTNTDTEVVLKLYEKYGLESFSMLDGMFAFSIVDLELDKTYLVRDFFGEKPLHYYYDNNKIIWASELKSIIKILPSKPPISKKALGLYFRLTYIPSPYSIYQKIRKLKQGHYMEIDNKTFELNFSGYKKETDFNYNNISFAKAKSQTFEYVNKSVKSRLISDVPLGTFLSGGVDSSIISLCHSLNSSSKIDTFSVSFSNKSFDESLKSKLVSKLINSNHHEIKIDINTLGDDIEFLNNFDEPFADSSSIPMYFISKYTKQNVKVVLSGDGGDELFGGYNKYLINKLNKNYISFMPEIIHKNILKLAKNILTTSSDKRGFSHKLLKFLSSVNYTSDPYLSIISLGFNDQEINNYINENYFIDDIFNEYKKDKLISLTDLRNIDRLLSLEGDMLVKVDRTTMLNSLECRAPFLNYDLWRFTSSIDESFLLNNWNKKYLLKESFKRFFPEKFLDKQKKGFEVPVGDWLRLSLKKELLNYCEDNFLDNQNIFKKNEIKNLIMNHISGKSDNTFKVWTFFCFQKWYNDIYLN